MKDKGIQQDECGKVPGPDRNQRLVPLRGPSWTGKGVVPLFFGEDMSPILSPGA